MKITSTLQFEGFITDKIEYCILPNQIESDVQFYFEDYPQIKENKCSILLGIKLTDCNRRDGKTLQLEAAIKGDFSLIDAKMNDQIVEGLVIPNGVAILFPYLRTLVSTISGYDTQGEGIILPTINVTKLLQRQKNSI